MNEENKKEYKFFINPERLTYLMRLYKLTKDEFFYLLNTFKYKKTERKQDRIDDDLYNDILNKKIDVDKKFLKRIGDIFNKDPMWVTSNLSAPSLSNSSVFFRKTNFNTNLSFASKKKVAEYEELKSDINLMSYYTDVKQERVFRLCKDSDDPETVANEIYTQFLDKQTDLQNKKIINKVLPNRKENLRSFLENIIRVLEQFNIFVFEFVETWNQVEKVDFGGFFIDPNIIVLKRTQDSMRREIFTLIHEFGHYLINGEEIDGSLKYEDILDSYNNNNKTEKWCNEFAFYFLLNNYKDEYSVLSKSDFNVGNEYQEQKVRELSSITGLSMLSIYMKLLIDGRINNEIYNNRKQKSDNEIKKEQQKKDEEKQRKKELGIEVGGSIPKRIESNILRNLVIENYFCGNIDEPKLRSILKVPDKLKIEDVIY